MKHSEKSECPTCGAGTFQRSLVGTSLEFLSKQPGDAVIKEVYKTVSQCDEFADAPSYQIQLTDIVKNDERVLNHYY